MYMGREIVFNDMCEVVHFAAISGIRVRQNGCLGKRILEQFKKSGCENLRQDRLTPLNVLRR